MIHRLVIGTGIGLVTGLMSWRGNVTANVVSVFPDGLTLVVLAALLVAAIRFELRRTIARDGRESLRTGLTIAAAAGMVFGSAVVALGIARFSAPSAALSAFLFFVAVLSSMGIGVVASVLMARSTARAA
ncbi:MAG TPA: hypothetical protein PKW63_16155 [Vicinamibacterales bacterium]|nr:hypothetical protein [Vicinamibacterales bacterium]